jgi:hypothetical protein
MRRWNLIIALLLTGMVFVTFAEADENDLFLQITSPAPEVTTAKATLDCNTTSADLLPLANVVFAASLAEDVCGQCGSSYCWGAPFEAPCGNDGRQCTPMSFSCGAGKGFRCYCLSPFLYFSRWSETAREQSQMTGGQWKVTRHDEVGPL